MKTARLPRRRGEAHRAPIAMLIFSAVLLAIYAVASTFLRSSETRIAPMLDQNLVCDTAAWRDIPIGERDGCPDILEVSLGVSATDPVSEQLLHASVQVYPSGSLGGALLNGGWASKSMSIAADHLFNGDWLMRANTFISGRSIAIPTQVVKSSRLYPFDVYRGTWRGFAENAVSGDRIPVFLTATQNAVPGYDIVVGTTSVDEDRMTPIAHNLAGQFEYTFDISRSPVVRFQAILLALTMALGAVAGLVMTIVIIRGTRPPSLSALAWLATFLFALLAIRVSMPGSPPMGILLDAVITIPAALLILALIAVTAVSWLRRPDWDMENEDDGTVFARS